MKSKCSFVTDSPEAAPLNVVAPWVLSLVWNIVQFSVRRTRCAEIYMTELRACSRPEYPSAEMFLVRSSRCTELAWTKAVPFSEAYVVDIKPVGHFI